MVNYIKYYFNRLTNAGSTAIEGTPKEWHVIVLEVQTPGSIWSHQGRIIQDPRFFFTLTQKQTTIIQVDGSMKGLGAVLLQKGLDLSFMC